MPLLPIGEKPQPERLHVPIVLRTKLGNIIIYSMNERITKISDLFYDQAFMVETVS